MSPFADLKAQYQRIKGKVDEAVPQVLESNHSMFAHLSYEQVTTISDALIEATHCEAIYA